MIKFPNEPVSKTTILSLYPNRKALEVYLALYGIDFNEYYVVFEISRNKSNMFALYARYRTRKKQPNIVFDNNVKGILIEMKKMLNSKKKKKNKGE